MKEKEPASYVPPPEFLVSTSDEEEFCRQHQAELARLSNGATVVGINRPVSDLAISSVVFSFPHGFYYDPPGKVGLCHLVEHFLNSEELRARANVFDGRIHAQVQALNLRNRCWAPANRQAMDYGIWPMIPLTISSLADPLSFFPDPEKALEARQGRIELEILREHGKHDYWVGRALSELLFAVDNPIRANGLGSLESLRDITIQDVQGLVNEALIPDGLFVSLFHQGDQATCQEVFRCLQVSLGQFPREIQRARRRDNVLLEKTNPDFSPGQVSFCDTGINNRQISLLFNWITRSDPFSVSTFALNRLLAQIDHQLEIYCSNTGRSYFWDVITKTPGRLTRTVTLRLDVDRGIMNNTSLIKHRLWPEIKERVLAPVFQPETIRTIMNREKKRLEVNPVRVGTYNEWMLSGLVEWGRMVDYDRVLRGYLNIAPGDFNLWEEQFLTEEPVILVVGDLS